MKAVQKLFFFFVLLTNILFGASYTYNLQKGWNLVGIILEPSEDSARELLSHPVYEFQNGGGNSVFQQSEKISAGKAYWLYWDQDGEFVLQGTPVAGGVIPGGVDFGIEGYQALSENIAIAEGSTVTRTASDIAGYRFTGWTVDGVEVDDKTQKTITFVMPDNQVVLTPNYEKAPEEIHDYMVVTLATGEVRYTDTPPDISDDTCRTTELWLRRIPAGSFTMGSPKGEVGRDATDETQHQVTLTQDYYIGVFETTQRQYEIIMGTRPSYFRKESDYATRPVEQVSYDMIRVGNDSFLEKLRTKTGLAFNLPTEAQWEYACRAETTTALNTGENLKSDEKDAAMDTAGRYNYNGGEDCEEYEVYDKGYYNDAPVTAGTAKVGSYPPNAWGLYDMHGNVSEWCQDWYGKYSGDATDPAGSQSGADRIMRGGSWDEDAGACRSAYRDYYDPAKNDDEFGFRIAL